MILPFCQLRYELFYGLQTETVYGLSTLWMSGYLKKVFVFQTAFLAALEFSFFIILWIPISQSAISFPNLQETKKTDRKSR